MKYKFVSIYFMIFYVLHFVYCMEFGLPGEQCEVQKADMDGRFDVGIVTSFIEIVEITA